MIETTKLVDLHDRVRHCVITILNIPQNEICLDTELFSLPGFDSMAIVNLMTALENEFRVTIEFTSIIPENLETLATLEQLIRRLIIS